MTTTESDLQASWTEWHASRESDLSAPHGWLSLTALHWLDGEARRYDGLPGTWRAVVGGGGVEVTAGASDGVIVNGRPVAGTVRLEPADGVPGVLVTIGERRVEVIRRTASYALRVRDPGAITRTAFSGAPAFPVEDRWVVIGRFERYAEPRRLVVGAVVDGLHHYPTAVGTVRFELDGSTHELVALQGKAGGLTLHFRDLTSGGTTYGGGRLVQLADPAEDGRITIDLNRTVNLPCAFTEFATCPLPPADNQLTVAVAAGEQTPPRPDLAELPH